MDIPRVETVVPATADQLGAIHAALERFLSAVDARTGRLPAGDWQIRFVTAVAEIAGNIVRYAYPDGMEVGPMRLQLRAYPDHVEACFSDQGVAFIPSTVNDEANADPLAMLESGRGLAIARACLDALDYRRTEDQTNEWRLVKSTNSA